MSPPNIRDLVGDIREALERFPREALVEILTYVFKEYVVEGEAPIAGSPPQLRDDLEGMSFAEVIRSLQLRLDLPELGLFEVQGERVTVKIGGRPMVVETQASRPDPLPVAPPPLAAPTPPPAGLTSLAVAVPAAQPRSGATSGAPTTQREELPLLGAAAAPGGGTRATPAPAAPGPATPAPAKPTAAPTAVDETADQTGRFGLLEID